MTNEEAVGELKSIIKTKEYTLDYAKDFRDENIDIDSLTNSIEKLELAIQALEKQIPKKQVYNWLGLRECGLCAKQVKWGNDYCPSCGQAIEWR